MNNNEVIVATDDEIIAKLYGYTNDVSLWLKEQFNGENTYALSEKMPGMSFVATRRLINITRNDPILGKLYAFTHWGYPKRLVGSNPEKWLRPHCIALFANGPRNFYVDMTAFTIRYHFAGETIHEKYPTLDSIPNTYIDTRPPWYFESEYDRKMEKAKPTEKVKIDILNTAYELNKHPEKRSLMKVFLDFITHIRHKN